MSEFTKGKWLIQWVATKVGKQKHIEIDASVSVNDGVFKSIAKVSRTDPEAQANARLIVAAPELYDAVCDLLDYAYEALHWAGGEAEIRGKAPKILRDIQQYQQLLNRIDGKEAQDEN